MRVSGDNPFELCFSKGLQVLLDQLLEQTFFANAAHIIACIIFVLIHDPKIKTSLLEDASDHFCVGNHALIEGSRVTHKPEILHWSLGCILDRELHLLRPASAQSFALAHPVSVCRERLQGILHTAVNLSTVNDKRK